MTNKTFEYPCIKYLYNLEKPYNAHTFHKEHIITALISREYRVANAIKVTRKTQKELLMKESQEKLFNLVEEYIKIKKIYYHAPIPLTDKYCQSGIFNFVSWYAIWANPNKTTYVLSLKME